jgi:co-chaperonin GroES (HSP10)
MPIKFEVNDKRKFTTDGVTITPHPDGTGVTINHGHESDDVERRELVVDAIAPEGEGGKAIPGSILDQKTHVTDAEVSKFLASAPKVYDDPRPLNDRVLIKQHVAETIFAGTTFVIPEVAQKHPNAGIVIAIGPEVDAEKDCAPNDLVIFNVYSAEEVTLDGERFVHVSKHDIHLRQRVSYAVKSSD